MDWETLNARIGEFECISGYGFSGMASLIIPRDWRRVWNLAREIQDGFKGVRYPTAADRQSAWMRFQDARSHASIQCDSEKRSREATSARHQEWTIKLICDSEVRDGFIHGTPDAEDLKRWGACLNEAARYLSDHKGEMLSSHKKECFERIQEVRKQHDLYWGEVKKAWSRKQSEWEDRKADRVRRLRANLESNLERRRKAADALEKMKSSADNLRSQIASAWNEDWASKAEGWLSELEDKIADTEKSLDQIDDWIKQDEENLRN